MRPFWIVQRKVTERDTCLCTLHENIRLLVSKLKQKNMITEKTPSDIIKQMCCENVEGKENCLERQCKNCKEKTVKFLDYDKVEAVSYSKWILKTENILVKRKPKKVKKNVKEVISVTADDLAKELVNQLPKFMPHTCNIIHQHKALKELKQNLSSHDVVLHMDFSENYACKFSSEIQAFHFGGSQEQVCIHTVMLYYKPPEAEETQALGMCTLSDSLNHDSSAIIAHLNPIFKRVEELVPQVKSIHFISDGPTTQYRNRNMFKLMITEIPSRFPFLKSFSWNYSEAGHGKGAPDGLGGTLKRTADLLVARGKDINNFDQFFEELQKNIKGIKISLVQKSVVESQSFSNTDTTYAFKGTLRTHQVNWEKEKRHNLNFRRLSCFNCPINKCLHYDIGTMNYNRVGSTVKKAECIL